MNRRIRSIFWLMTLCILGINAFQGYWLWTTYQLNRQQFSRTVQDALFEIVQQRQMADANRLFRHQSEPKKSGKEVSHMIVRQYNTGSDGDQIRVFVDETVNHSTSAQPRGKRPNQAFIVRGDPNQPSGTPVQADTLARRISNLLLLDWAEGTRINLPKLSAAYRDELRQRGIDASFRLDTVSVKPQRTSANVLIFRSHSANNPAKTSDSVRTTPVPINPVRNLFAQASFATPTYYLLRQMGWLLGSSVFLLLLTTGSFLFMLATILRQKKLSEVKNDFINNMTHELKTPIATVAAAVEALQNFGALNDPQKTQTYLSVSRTNLQRLSDLVEKVLTLAVEEKKELVLNPEWIKPSELINQALSNYQLKADKPVDFEVDIEAADEPIRIDRFHMANAINNLIDNAIKYSRESVTIRVSSRKHERVWRLSVKDNGIGIPESYQSAIFDRFFRVPTGDLHSVKGFGLGLSYVRQVLEKHSGLIEVISEPGEGSEFILLLPEQGGDGQAGIKRFPINLNLLHS